MTTIKTEDGLTITLTDEQLADIDRQRKQASEPWQPPARGKPDDLVFLLCPDGYIDKFERRNCTSELCQGDVLETLKEAQNERDWRNLNWRITEFIRIENEKLDWVADFNKNQQHHYLYINSQRTLARTHFCTAQCTETRNLFNKDVYQKLRDTFTDDELITWIKHEVD